jgi:dipeptidyl aminopeptidase/acylaminoacyl peptidase
MPWEGAEVHIGDIIVDSGLDGFSIKNDVYIAGKPIDISCAYLEWSSNDTLIFTSDESKFINPWKYTVTTGRSTPLFPKPVPQEFGSPMWTLDTFPYTILDKESRYALFIAIKDGRDELQLVDLEGGVEPQRIETPYVVIGGLRSVSKENSEVVFIGEKVNEKGCIVKCTVSTSGGSPKAICTVIKSVAANETSSFPKEIISTPQPMTIQGRYGDVHVVFYPPRNPQYSGSSIDGERPPCVVHVHGGPTGLQGQGLQWMVQYFTSRGWAWYGISQHRYHTRRRD